MVRIEGINLPANKRIVIALTYIYGIGPAKSKKILETLKIDESVRTKDLTEGDEAKLREEMKKHTTEGDLRRQTSMHIKRLKEIGTYRGFRHRKGLPLRGQRTQCNARTRRGRKKVGVGSGKRKDAKK